MEISGRSLQFSIGSAISFQFRAGFTSTQYAKQQSQDQLKPRQEEEFARLKSRDIDTKRQKEAPFYEVVGPYSNGSSASTRRAAPATIALPAKANEQAALVSADLSSRDRQIARVYGRGNANRQDLTDGVVAYLHSYNQNGQRVFTMTETSTIDMVI